jgi:putative membrane protein
MMTDGWGGYGGGMGVAGGIIMLILWVAVIVGIVLLVIWLVRQAQGGPVAGTGAPQQGGVQTALDILKARYARGEIDKAEFEEKKKDLIS